MKDTTDFSGQVALITGSTRGLGRAMAEAFARAGATVVISSRKADACQATAAEIATETGATTLPVAAHVGHWGELERLADTVYEAYGRIDVLINNAGIAPVYPSLAEVSEDLFDKVVSVNLKGPFRLTALVGARMAAAGCGSIVNISSMASQRPTRHDLPYAMAKAGLNVMTAGFAQEYGPSVRVNTILAGPFFTDIASHWDMEAFEEMAAEWPLQRGGEPHEIVGAAMYFASPASSFTTGAVLAVDGGRCAAP